MADTQTEYEDASSRATRARTRLVVEGFANLALVAILFCGVQAQLISVTNEYNDNKLSIATNAVFFGGLIFSVFAAMLATLSGRWFSILREDDADYLSSRWLAQDCAEDGNILKLEKYLDFQIAELEIKKKKEELEQLKRRDKLSLLTAAIENLRNNASPTSGTSKEVEVDQSVNAVKQNKTELITAVENTKPGKETSPTSDISNKVNPDELPFNPNMYDIDRIIQLLRAESESGEGGLGKTTWREEIVSWTLISPLAVCCAAFMLFCAGILMLAWNKQRREVAIFTSATVLVCLVILVCFFLRHRHKHVIKNLYLNRPAF